MDAASAEKKKAKNKKKKEQQKKKKQEEKNKVEGGAEENEPRSDVQVFDEKEFKALPSHKFFSDCGVLKLSLNKLKGRHVVASLPINAGVTVMECTPYVAIVRDEMVDKFCHRCLKNVPSLYKCQECEHAHFCSNQCMNALSKLHLLECKALKNLHKLNLSGSPTTAIRAVMRMMYLSHKEKEHETKGSNKTNIVFKPKPGLCYQDASALAFHNDMWSDEERTAFVMAFSRLEDIMERKDFLSIPEAIRLLMQIQVNAHQIVDVNGTHIGMGVYPPASFINHSCRPNCSFHIGPNGSLVLQAIKPIPAGTEVTYSYIDPYQGRKARNAALKYFTCNCERCKEDAQHSRDRFIDGFICPTCFTLPPDVEGKEGKEKKDSVDQKGLLATWNFDPEKTPAHTKIKCKSCEKEYEYSALLDAEEAIKLLTRQGRQMLQTGAEQDTKDARDLLISRLLEGEQAKLLHPYHHLLFNVYLLLSEVCRGLKDYELQVKYCLLALKAFQAVGLAQHPECFDVYYSLGEAYVGIANQLDKKIHGVEAEEIPLETILADLKLKDSEEDKSEKHEKRRIKKQLAQVIEYLKQQKDHYVSLAREAYHVSFKGREICWGPKYELTKITQDKYNRLARKGDHKQAEEETEEHEKTSGKRKGKKK